MKKSKHVWGVAGFVLGAIFGGRVYLLIRKVL